MHPPDHKLSWFKSTGNFCAPLLIYPCWNHSQLAMGNRRGGIAKRQPTAARTGSRKEKRKPVIDENLSPAQTRPRPKPAYKGSSSKASSEREMLDESNGNPEAEAAAALMVMSGREKQKPPMARVFRQIMNFSSDGEDNVEDEEDHSSDSEEVDELKEVIDERALVNLVAYAPPSD